MESRATIETMLNHVTIRQFTEKDISSDILEQILQAARRAPTSSNMQAYSVIVVRDPEKKKELARLAGNQEHVATCPVFLAFCADLHRLERVAELHDTAMTNNLESFLIATIDAALVGMNAQTAAESLGLGAVMIGAMRNAPDKVAELLALPRGVYVTYGMCIGWPDMSQIPAQKPRLPESLVIHREHYELADFETKIRAHDAELARHYEQQGRNLSADAWSGVIARNMSRPMRPENLDKLQKMGFHICGEKKETV